MTVVQDKMRFHCVAAFVCKSSFEDKVHSSLVTVMPDTNLGYEVAENIGLF